MMPNIALNLGALRELYRSREARPSEVVAEVYRRIHAGPIEPVWISLVPREIAIARARKLEADSLAAAKPLFGVPFAIKDNIDLAGVATTAGCPAYAYLPSGNATVVQTPGGRRRHPHRQDQSRSVRHRAGGHAFPLRRLFQRLRPALHLRRLQCRLGGRRRLRPGQFRPGDRYRRLRPRSRRVQQSRRPEAHPRPAQHPRDVVPACRTLDCVSIFTHTCHDAHTVLQAARGFDPLDPFSRAPAPGQDAAPWLAGTFRFGVRRRLTARILRRCRSRRPLSAAPSPTSQSMGGEKVEIDFAPFRAAADLLYSGPWVAERLAAIRGFLERPCRRDGPCRSRDHFRRRALHRRRCLPGRVPPRELRRASEAEWARMDVLVLPTTGTIYTHERWPPTPSASTPTWATTPIS